MFQRAYLLLCLNILTFCSPTHTLEQKEIDTSATEPKTPEIDLPLIKISVTEGNNSVRFILSQSIVHAFYNCICDLEAIGCNIENGYVNMQRILSDQWAFRFFYAKYFCPLWSNYIACKRFRTNDTTSSWQDVNKKQVLNVFCPNFPDGFVNIFWNENQTMTITNFSDVSNLFERILGEEILLQEDSSTSPQCELDWEEWLLTALVIVSILINFLKLYSCLRSYRRFKPQNETSYSFETDSRSHMHSETDMCGGLAYSKSEPVGFEI